MTKKNTDGSGDNGGGGGGGGEKTLIDDFIWTG